MFRGLSAVVNATPGSNWLICGAVKVHPVIAPWPLHEESAELPNRQVPGGGNTNMPSGRSGAVLLHTNLSDMGGYDLKSHPLGKLFACRSVGIQDAGACHGR